MKEYDRSRAVMLHHLYGSQYHIILKTDPLSH
jgi:hypothetical protein